MRTFEETKFSVLIIGNFNTALKSMNEVKEYDYAANKFYSSVNINSLPLNSWDLYASFFQSICKSYNDINVLTELAKDKNWSYAERFRKELIEKNTVIVVTDLQLRIVYATQNISTMNGYQPSEVLGKTPKMFQGVDTCKETSMLVRKAVQNKQPFETTILNYRKDGATYKCWIKGEPVFNTSGEVVNFIAYEKEVA